MKSGMRGILTAAFAVLAITCAPVAIAAPDVAISEEGIVVSIPAMGNFNLGYPILSPGDRKPVQKKVSGNSADLVYADDIAVHVDVTADGKVNLKFTNARSVKSFGLTTRIGARFGDEGGTWTIGKVGPSKFPLEKPAKPHLFQGSAGDFSLSDGAGHTLSIAGFPNYAYQELSDLREWGWKTFAWKVWVPYNPDWAVHSFVIGETPNAASAAAPPRKTAVLVDRFGQTTLKDFPRKVKDETELKADATAEAGYWKSYKPLAVDKWGGLPGSKERLGLNATGFFRVEKKGDRWLLVNPDGNATFHLGICVFAYNPGDETTYIEGRRGVFEWLPPTDGEFASAYHPEKWWHDKAFSFYAANVIRKYGQQTTKDEQLGRLVERVRAVGFNAAGAFSGSSPVFEQKHFPRVQQVSFSPELPGIRGIADPFDEEVKRATEERWAKSLPQAANDPLIVGYFFGNEQAFEDIARGVPQLPGKYAAKRKLVEMLQHKYPTISQFNAAWNLDLADFSALADKGLPVTTQAAFVDMQMYTEIFLDAYFRFLSETFRKYDKNHLMLSNRWQPGTANNETLCRIAGKYMDVISINYYTWGVDRGFVERLYRWTGDKPQMWSEFFYSSGSESNAASWNLDLATQSLRGQAYRNYTEQAAALGFVIGIEWFSLVDQAVTGRWFSKLNGERANNGLFNVCDRPYDGMLREMAKSNAVVYEVLLDGRKPFALDDPRFASHRGKNGRRVQAGHAPAGGIKIDGLVDGWPGRPPERVSGNDHLAVGKDSAGLEGTFKLAWDEMYLYVLANITDPTPLSSRSEGAQLWRGDAVELFIGSERLDQPGAILFSDRQVLLGGHRQAKAGSTYVVNAAKQPEILLVNVPTVDGSGYTLEAAIPWSALDVKPTENKELLFEFAIDDAPADGNRTRQIMWNGGGTNSNDRSNWGRLTLVP